MLSFVGWIQLKCYLLIHERPGVLVYVRWPNLEAFAPSNLGLDFNQLQMSCSKRTLRKKGTKDAPKPFWW